ncbi:MAG: PEP-CTERM sorting domain-containing protein [Sedimentisphaerales bacterium]|nr:PEP-CTERM sorting domain-containing protein [Sedimentisphaerales bacterium]
MRLRLSVAISILAALLPYTALADWKVGDKASYYQLPSYTGWDVYSEWGTGPLADEGYGAADDWTATTNEAVTGIHFWGSWKEDRAGETGKILLQIFSNDTISGGPGSFPRPDELLWSRVIEENQYQKDIVYTSPTKDQGWYDPRDEGDWDRNEHKEMWQYNIPDIDSITTPFVQEAGQTYWLEISMDFMGCEWGWKTTDSVSGNPGVFWDSFNTWDPHCTWWRHPEIEWKWTQLETPHGWHDPRVPQDLAFVIVPEPATLFLLAIGAAAMLRRRKR